MDDTEPDLESKRDPQAGSQPTPLRRRQNVPVEVDRRRSRSEGFDIAGALELHLDQCKTRRSMIALLEQWLTEARHGEQEIQNPEYADAVERAIEVMKRAPDIESGIVMLQRR